MALWYKVSLSYMIFPWIKNYLFLKHCRYLIHCSLYRHFINCGHFGKLTHFRHFKILDIFQYRWFYLVEVNGNSTFKVNIHHKHNVGLKCFYYLPVHHKMFYFWKFVTKYSGQKFVYSCAQLFGFPC